MGKISTICITHQAIYPLHLDQLTIYYLNKLWIFGNNAYNPYGITMNTSLDVSGTSIFNNAATHISNVSGFTTLSNNTSMYQVLQFYQTKHQYYHHEMYQVLQHYQNLQQYYHN